MVLAIAKEQSTAASTGEVTLTYPKVEKGFVWKIISLVAANIAAADEGSTRFRVRLFDPSGTYVELGWRMSPWTDSLAEFENIRGLEIPTGFQLKVLCNGHAASDILHSELTYDLVRPSRTLWGGVSPW